MDSPGNFCMYNDSEYFVDKSLQKPDEVFLFGGEDNSMNFGGLADYTGLFENENSIDLNAYINPSGSTDNYMQLAELLPPSSPPKSTIPSELPPPLIRPEEAVSSNSQSFVQSTAPSNTVADLPDSMPSSSRPQFMPQHRALKEEAAALQVKAEPQEKVEPASAGYLHEEDDFDEYDDDSSTYTSGPSRPVTPVPSQRGRKPTPGSKSSTKSSASKRNRPIPDKESDEYREKRFKNNIAVRRSREKSKEKSAQLQGKVSELTTENDRLNKRVELLTKELTVLKSLFTNVGKSAPHGLSMVTNM